MKAQKQQADETLKKSEDEVKRIKDDVRRIRIELRLAEEKLKQMENQNLEKYLCFGMIIAVFIALIIQWLQWTSPLIFQLYTHFT